MMAASWMSCVLRKSGIVSRVSEGAKSRTRGVGRSHRWRGERDDFFFDVLRLASKFGGELFGEFMVHLDVDGLDDIRRFLEGEQGAGCLKFKVLDNQGGKFTVCCELVEEVEGNIGDCGVAPSGFADVGLRAWSSFLPSALRARVFSWRA